MKITDQELDELMLFSGTYKQEDSEQVKADWISTYRRVEEESIEMITKYGSVEAWYESGEGRLL